MIDLDIRKFFDSVPWELVVKAVEAQHRPAVGGAVCATVAARAAAAAPTARCGQRDRGTPQGSAVSPVLANLFLHVCHECEREVECR